MVEVTQAVNDALNRLKRASDRGTGCYLTADMVCGLSLTTLAEAWSEPDPRIAQAIQEQSNGE